MQENRREGRRSNNHSRHDTWTPGTGQHQKRFLGMMTSCLEVGRMNRRSCPRFRLTRSIPLVPSLRQMDEYHSRHQLGRITARHVRIDMWLQLRDKSMGWYAKPRMRASSEVDQRTSMENCRWPGTNPKWLQFRTTKASKAMKRSPFR